MRFVARALLAAVAAIAASPGTAASISESTNYFTVRGSTLQQLDRELARKGPAVGLARVSHAGATQVRFGGNVTYASTGGDCRVATTAFDLNLVKILPRWTKPKAASAVTSIVWKTLSDDIARHEAGHVAIATSYAKRMESAVRNLGTRSTCETMQAAVNATTARFLKEHETAQLAYDAKEGREMSRRLNALLRRNLKAAAAPVGN